MKLTIYVLFQDILPDEAAPLKNSPDNAGATSSSPSSVLAAVKSELNEEDEERGSSADEMEALTREQPKSLPPDVEGKRQIHPGAGGIRMMA